MAPHGSTRTLPCLACSAPSPRRCNWRGGWACDRCHWFEMDPPPHWLPLAMLAVGLALLAASWSPW